MWKCVKNNSEHFPTLSKQKYINLLLILDTQRIILFFNAGKNFSRLANHQETLEKQTQGFEEKILRKHRFPRNRRKLTLAAWSRSTLARCCVTLAVGSGFDCVHVRRPREPFKSDCSQKKLCGVALYEFFALAHKIPKSKCNKSKLQLFAFASQLEYIDFCCRNKVGLPRTLSLCIVRAMGEACVKLQTNWYSQLELIELL